MGEVLDLGGYSVSRPLTRIIPRRIGYGDYSLMSAAPPPGVAVRTFCTPGMARRRVATSAAWEAGVVAGTFGPGSMVKHAGRPSARHLRTESIMARVGGSQ